MRGQGAQRERRALQRLQAEARRKLGKRLDKGWSVASKQRSSGKSVGHTDVYYFSPSGLRYRSRTEVLEMLTSARTPAKRPKPDAALLAEQGVAAAAAAAQLEARAQGFPLAELPGDVLAKVLARLPAWDLLQVSAACRQLAQAAEPSFEAACAQNPDWQRRRGSRARAAKAFQWRSLYWQNACRTCGAAGEVSVRRASSDNCAMRIAPVAFWICKRCHRRPEVSSQLASASCSVQHC